MDIQDPVIRLKDYPPEVLKALKQILTDQCGGSDVADIGELVTETGRMEIAFRVGLRRLIARIDAAVQEKPKNHVP